MPEYDEDDMIVRFDGRMMARIKLASENAAQRIMDREALHDAICDAFEGLGYEVNIE